MVFDLFYCFIVCQGNKPISSVHLGASIHWAVSVERLYLQGLFNFQLSFGNFVPLPIEFLLSPPAAPGSLMMSYDVFCIE